MHLQFELACIYSLLHTYNNNKNQHYKDNNNNNKSISFILT